MQLPALPISRTEVNSEACNIGKCHPVHILQKNICKILFDRLLRVALILSINNLDFKLQRE